MTINYDKFPLLYKIFVLAVIVAELFNISKFELFFPAFQSLYQYSYTFW
ncbi:hypothetical protein HMPREF0379_0180 [[Eubacterium] yurii subsp. margaretiae ATCC 43715]|nr:hypothetical protein HMPREF0379_0180 [[Eubacterium] yurii subsp. margaretiae ATCC 43715]